mgnify:CR=1 FL=1
MYYFPVSALLIEYLILTIVDSRDSYGYEISQTIKLVADIKESTLYPILKRLEKGENLPLLTSCCPAWVKFVQDQFPDYKENISTCRSPQQKILLHHSFRQRTDALSAYRMERLPGHH